MNPRRAVNLATILGQTARRLPHHDALVHGDVRWSWSELDARTTALARELARLGVCAGDCVLLDGPNHPEFVQAMFAVWRAGAVVAPVNSRLHDRDIADIARVCRPRAVIAHADTSSHVDAVRAEMQRADLPVLIIGGNPDAPGAIGGLPHEESRATSAGADDAVVLVGDPAWYFFTSGTSGTPKAAVLTHDQLGYVVTNHLADLMPTTGATHRSLVLAPLSHGAGVHLLPQVARGAASVIPVSPSLDPPEVWRLVQRERVTNMFTVPTILTRTVNDPAVDTFDHGSLEYVIYAGAPMARRDQDRARAALGDVLVQYYGLAEVTGNITVLPRDDHDRQAPTGIDITTCGRPRTGMGISIQDEDGVELGPLETGEICVSGPGVFAGYLDNEAADAAAFRNGWFRTGDVGMLDLHGYLYITGRVSDMYISGGSNIHPRPIEEKLLDHPDIDEVVVLGMPDPTWGEVGVAVCVPAAGTSLDEAEVRAWMTQRVARYKVPRYVVSWDALPRSGYGKVTRRTVREHLVERGWEPGIGPVPTPATSRDGVLT
ncbi:AMP-binding protein [Oryzobacter telluris]|uniref:AMP-binding protein n=1 Tax=Oryzobacter telluris TaxID=3149179 RepID=UPI00370D5E85